MRFGVALAVASTLSGHALAQTSADYAMMTRKSSSAFLCAALAYRANDGQEYERLLNVGYWLGKTYLEALEQGKVNREDISSTVPFGLFTYPSEGPSTDFKLGRIYESHAELAQRFAFADAAVGDEKAYQANASAEFERRNCSLIN